METRVNCRDDHLEMLFHTVQPENTRDGAYLRKELVLHRVFVCVVWFYDGTDSLDSSSNSFDQVQVFKFTQLHNKTMSTKNPSIVLFDQPVRAEILLSQRWDTRTVPAFKGTGDQFYDQYILGGKINKHAPPTDPVEEMKIKIQKYEAVFQLLLVQASEISALVQQMTTELPKPPSRRNKADDD